MRWWDEERRFDSLSSLSNWFDDVASYHIYILIHWVLWSHLRNHPCGWALANNFVMCGMREREWDDDEETNHTTLVYLGCARWSGVQIWPDWNEKKNRPHIVGQPLITLYIIADIFELTRDSSNMHKMIGLKYILIILFQFWLTKCTK